MSTTALAVRDDQDYWDDKQLAVLQSMGVGKDVTEGELRAYLHECKRRKLDPFIRQIYLIGRWNNRTKRTEYRSQTSIDGFRLIARRAADKASVDYGYEGTIWFDEKAGKHEVWLGARPPVACKVVVVRNGSRYDAVGLYSEYVQTDRDGNPIGMWRTMPANQLAKCTEALALRKAFPEDLGGLYTEEEMAQADNPQRVTATAEIIREERVTPPAAEPAPNPVVSGEQDPWATGQAQTSPLYDKLIEHAATVETVAAARQLWSALAALHKNRQCSAEQRREGEELLTARIADISAAQEPADVVEGVIVADLAPGLEPGDPWHEAVLSVASSDDADALIANVGVSVKNGSLSKARGDQVIAAVRARLSSMLAGAK